MPRILWAVMVMCAVSAAWAQERVVPFAQQVQAAEGMIIANFRGMAENRFQGTKFYRGSFQLQQVAGIYNRHIIYKDNFKVSFWGISENQIGQLALMPGESYLLLLKKGPTGFELVNQAQSIFHLENSLGEVYLVSKTGPVKQDHKISQANSVLSYPQAQLVMAKKWQRDLSVAEQTDHHALKGRQIASEIGTAPATLGSLGDKVENKVAFTTVKKEDAELEEFLNKLWPVVILMFLSLVAKIIQNRQNKTWTAKNLR